jgi:hypothetical protein
MKSLPTRYVTLCAATVLVAIFKAPVAYAQGTGNTTNSSPRSGIFAGATNSVTSLTNGFIGAGQANRAIGGSASAVVAGLNNLLTNNSANSFIGAGNNNTIIGGFNTVIVSGVRNTNYAGKSVIVGGQQNMIGSNSRSSTIAGGEFNEIQAINPLLGTLLYATIGGGQSNLVGSNGVAATIGGGRLNEASAPGATVPGGSFNEATGTNSFAAGTRAVASHANSFVWGGSPDTDTTSFGNGTFTARAPGGAKFLTSVVDGIGAELVPSGASWTSLSDSNVKTGVTAIDHRQTLAKLAALPVTEWSYKHDTKRRYIGPMAQDFRAAFGLGYDDKHISTIDTDGVTMSAIKGLVEELQQQDNALDAREAQIRKLESAVQELREHLGENRL